MLVHPMYFRDVGGDGKQSVFCWSLSPCNGGVINYLWRVYWYYQLEPIFVLCQRFQHQESLHFGVGAYQFHVLSPDRRAIWRAVKPSGIFDQSNHHVTLYSEIQLNWLGSSGLAPDFNLIQPQARALPGFPYEMADNLAQDFADPCVNPADTSFSLGPTRSTQGSDTSSIASIDALDSEDDEELVTGGSGRYFAVHENRIPTLLVPRSLKTPEDVKFFVASALASGELDKGVRRVKCSLCKNKKANKEWEIKPSNLERHIFNHSHIECYFCLIGGCTLGFTTKDQMNKHIAKKHKEMLTIIQYLKTEEGLVARDMYTASTPPMRGMEIGEVIRRVEN
ncbi:unnamed protein product [Rhizoctonia solani]|uniref:C2H2-type domain-containing protein n=1 Tax=Rhizoctonia solani TaxID=456999 RepID=A0A8H3CIW4_9AGAM|nr:unnamed protein product [Rhizoctonia solani]